jgi:hypothetical protein
MMWKNAEYAHQSISAGLDRISGMRGEEDRHLSREEIKILLECWSDRI